MGKHGRLAALAATAVVLAAPAAASADVIFNARITYAVAGQPERLAVGDFDGDSKPDLVTSESGGAGNSVFSRLPSGIFGTAQPIAAGGASSGAATGDFDGDGHVDVALAQPSLNQVTVLWGTATGLGTTGTSYPAGASPVDVAAGDVDGDGRPDLVVANHTTIQVSVLRSDPVGRGFSAPAGVDMGTGPNAVELADFTGDGKLDLIATLDVGGMRLTPGNGDGTWAAGGSTPAGTSPADIAVGDFNRDGLPDIAVANAGSDDVSVNLGRGGGLFWLQKLYPLPAGSAPTGVVAGDFTNDGRDDLAVMTSGTSTVSVLRMAADGTVAGTESFSSGESPTRGVAADFDGDGMLDLAVSSTPKKAVQVMYVNAVPSAVTTATDATLGAGTITGQYALSDAGPKADGTVTLRVYGDAACATSPLATETLPFTGAKTYTTTFAPPHAGTYWWSFEYTGDGDSTWPHSAPCAASSTVAKASTTITTTGSDATVGAPIDGTATLTGAAPTGAITLRAYATPDCSGTPAYDGTGTSGSFTPAHAGSYRWVASYPGDGDNLAVATTCASAAVSAVAKASPTLTAAGENATLAGGRAATGTLTFQAFTTADCTGDATASTATVRGDGAYATRPAPGSWKAVYSGDADNAPASSGCLTVPSPPADPEPEPDPAPPTVLPAPPFAAPAPAAARAPFTLTGVSGTRCVRKGSVNIGYTVSEAARVTFTLERRVKPAPLLRSKCPGPLEPNTKKVTFRGVKVAARTVSAKAGANRFKLSQKLPPGRYRVRVKATDAAGRTVETTVSFWVLR